MPGLDAIHLGNLICSTRKCGGLTQKELARQTGLAVKTIQDVEKGRKYPSYETLACLVIRLGISPDLAFTAKESVSISEEQQLLEMFRSCDLDIQDILLEVIHILIRLCLKNKYCTKELNVQEQGHKKNNGNV